MTVTATNSYLEGNFAPVTTEETLTHLEVEGTVPDHLDGRYLRNGPNPAGPVDPANYHWFLGSGMVHGLRLRNGEAEWYRNRWVRSADVAHTLGEPVRPGPVHAGMDFSANTNVVGHAGRTFAVVEGGGRPYELTHDLDTVGPCDFGGTLSGGYTAHPHRDPVSGELHAMSYFWGWGDVVQYSVLDLQGHVRHAIDIEVPGAPMMHDFSLTEDHVVVYDLPVTFDLDLVSSQPFPYRWNPDHPSRVGVLRRDGDGSDVRWFAVDPCYVYHPMNAFDHGNTVVLDVVRHASTMRTDVTGPFEENPALERWTVDLDGTEVHRTTLDDRPQEFPRIDERRTGRRHRYGYAPVSTSTDHDPTFDAVMRIDLEIGTETVRTFGAGSCTGEFVFVPSSPDAPEDDGVVMGFVHDTATDRTRLAILDAATLADVAMVHLPVRVPFGFHGNWVPSS